MAVVVIAAVLLPACSVGSQSVAALLLHSDQAIFVKLQPELITAFLVAFEHS